MRRPRLDVGAPVRLFHVPVQGPLDLYQFYEPARDGQRFLVNALVEGRGASSQVILGWQSLLTARGDCKRRATACDSPRGSARVRIAYLVPLILGRVSLGSPVEADASGRPKGSPVMERS